MSEKYITKKTLSKALANMINDNCVNKIHLTNLIINNISTWSIDLLTEIYFSDEIYVPFNINDYFKTSMNTYDTKIYHKDVLIDLGLLGENECIFGKIIGDDSYSSVYNPYYGRYKVVLFVHNEQNKFSELSIILSHDQMTKIKKEDIPYFDLPF